MARIPILPATLLLVALGGVAPAALAEDVPAQRAEIGFDDFRISFAGGTGDATFGVQTSAVAWGRQDQKFLVVWSAFDTTPGGDDTQEIWGVFVDPRDPQPPTDSDFRISVTGVDDTDITKAALSPAVAYNPFDDEFLVVWFGNAPASRATGRAFDPDFLLQGAIVDSTGQVDPPVDLEASGGPIFVSEEQFIQLGPPAVLFDRSREAWVVAWSAQATGGTAAGEYEIFLNRFGAVDLLPEGPAVRVSSMGPLGNPAFGAFHPGMVHNLRRDAYFVVWQGDDATDGKFEVWGEHVDATTLVPDGMPTALSENGPAGDPAWDAERPDVAWNPIDDVYLVTFRADNAFLLGTDDETEIWGQFFDASFGVGGPRGVIDNFRISRMGGLGDARRGSADFPTVVFSRRSHEFLVVWHGADGRESTARGEREIFARRVDATEPGLLGLGQHRLSSMGPALDPSWFGKYPALAIEADRNELLVTWRGADDLGGAADFQETEIYGQLFAPPVAALPDGQGTQAVGATAPAVARDPFGGYLEVFEHPDQEGSGIWARYLFGGQVVGGPVLLNDALQAGNQSNPDVAWDHRLSRFVVVWESDAVGATGIFGRQAASLAPPPPPRARGGLSLGAEFRINSPTRTPGGRGLFPTGPRISSSGPLVNDDPTMFVVWENPGVDGTDVAGNLFVTDDAFPYPGNPIGAEFSVGEPTGSQQAPAVAADPESETFLVVWENDLADADAKDVRALFYDARDPVRRGGLSLGAEFRVNLTAEGDQTKPSVAGGGESTARGVGMGTYVVVWESSDLDDPDIYGNRFPADHGATVPPGPRLGRGGLSLGAEFRVNGSRSSAQTEPEVAQDDSGSFVVVWDDYVEGEKASRSRGKVYDASTTAEDPVGQEFPVVAFDATGEPGPGIGQDRLRLDARDCEVTVGWQTLFGRSEGQSFTLEPQLQMLVLDGPDPLEVGQPLVYGVGLRNSGACPTGDLEVAVQVSDLLVSPFTTGCLNDRDSGAPEGTLLCALDPLGPGESGAFTVTGFVPAGAAAPAVESAFAAADASQDPTLNPREWVATELALFVDGFESGNAIRWDAVAP